MLAPDFEPDWADEARAVGWTDTAIARMDAAGGALGAVPVFIHADVIVSENAAGARFTTTRNGGSFDATARANRALAAAGLRRAA